MNELGLPDHVRSCLFDLDGVLTRTARLHAAAWKEMFDAFLRARSKDTGEPFVPFDDVIDYERYVDGKPRLDGTRSFLETRQIRLPEGTPSDSAGAPTVHGLSNEKNALVLRRMEDGEIEVFEDSVAYVRAVRARQLKTA